MSGPARAVLPYGAPRLTHDAYYARAAEFRAWLAEHDRYLDEMASDEARREFRRFVRRWNEGRLADAYYAGQAIGRRPSTRHRWSFAATHTPRDRRLEREEAQEQARRQKQHDRRTQRKETKEWMEEQAPRATGRDAVHERRREKAASNRAMADRHQIDDDVGDGMSTDALLGTGSSFHDAVAERDRVANGRTQRQEERMADRDAEREQRTAALQAKEQQTMAMLRSVRDPTYQMVQR